MKIIDLLNKIANGEEVPEKIEYKSAILEYDKNSRLYLTENMKSDLYCRIQDLNDEVEILKEKEICHKCHKYPAEYNQTYCEFCLGISKLEEKKIPEKWNDLSFTTMRKREDSIDDDIHKLKGYIETIMRTQNEVIDYLKIKGDE